MSMAATPQPEPLSSDISRSAAASLLLFLLGLVLVLPRVSSLAGSVSSILRLAESSLLYALQALAYTFVPIAVGGALFYFGFRLPRIAQLTAPLRHYRAHGSLIAIALLGPILSLLPAHYLFQGANALFLQGAQDQARMASAISPALPAVIGAILPYLSLWLRADVTPSEWRRQDGHWALVGMAMILTGLLVLVPVGLFNAAMGLMLFPPTTPAAFAILAIVSLPLIVGAAFAHAGARLAVKPRPAWTHEQPADDQSPPAERRWTAASIAMVAAGLLIMLAAVIVTARLGAARPAGITMMYVATPGLLQLLAAAVLVWAGFKAARLDGLMQRIDGLPKPGRGGVSIALFMLAFLILAPSVLPVFLFAAEIVPQADPFQPNPYGILAWPMVGLPLTVGAALINAAVSTRRFA